MAQRPSGSSSSGARSGSAKKRQPITVVKKPFPWGTAVGGGVLALALIGIIVYAATNQGAGFEDPLEVADKKFPGLSVTALDDLERDHVEGAVDYPSVPPVGGKHNSVPQQCDIYTEQIPTEHAVHSLEHGAVWVTYSPELPEDQVSTLADTVEGEPYGMLSPVPDQESPIMVTAWGRQIAVDSADDDRIGEFIETYVSGPQTPERGAACAGNASTGTLGEPVPAPTAPVSPAPASPEASAPAASPAASPPAASPAASPTG